MSEYDDSHMLSKVLGRMSAQALHLKDKIDSGLQIPSWAEYKIYNAYSGLGSALGTAYPGEYEEKMAAATFSKSMDRHPALKGKQSQLPDKVQAGIIKKKLRMRKQAASTESQVLKALSVEGGAAGMGALKKRVKEDDLQSAIKSLIASGKVRKHPDGDLIKESASTATKTDPAKWEAAKREAKAKMGGKHSARAMQLATQIYKKKGGGYSGAKPTSKNNSLKKWTEQKWGYSGKDKPGPGGSGVYLPEQKRQRLKSTAEGRKRLQAASAAKAKATRKGEQYSSHGLAKGTSLRKKEAAVLPDFLAMPIRREFMDPRSDDFNKNQAFGRAAGAYLAAAPVGAIVGHHYGGLGGLGVGATSAGLLAAAPTYAHSLRKFREMQDQGLNPVTGKPHNPEKIERTRRWNEQMRKRGPDYKALRQKLNDEVLEETKTASIEYRGKTFPGYNQPVRSDRPNKKMMVLAKDGDRVKLIHFGQKGYKHNYSDEAKANYLRRSAGIRGKGGKLTANDKMSANYWARRELWPKGKADGSNASAKK